MLCWRSATPAVPRSSAFPSNSYGASLSTTLTAGTYYLVARSVGDYGDVGQYNIIGSLPAAGSFPEIDLSVGGVTVADGGTINFGSTTVGSAVTQTITVANQGGRRADAERRSTPALCRPVSRWFRTWEPHRSIRGMQRHSWCALTRPQPAHFRAPFSWPTMTATKTHTPSL